MERENYFIADVHLDRDEAGKRELFFSFLDMVSSRGADLYILGDLFDYWANNRQVMNDHREVLNALRNLARTGSKVFFLLGNRDLLLGKTVLSRYDVACLGERTLLVLQGKRIMLTHGHLLLTNDVYFQRYRRTAWPVYRILDAVLPGWIENRLARRFMLRSKQVIDSQEPWRFQFPDETIRRTFAEGVDMIICGHTHAPLVREYDGKNTFVVLPSWNSQQGGYLCLKDGIYEVKNFVSNRNAGKRS
jgi:UDP-2,3-diacylglucosamine hydrolase